jgi:hypothetical protein
LAIAVSPLQRASCAAVDVDHAALDEILFNSEIFSDPKLTLVHGTDPNLTRPGIAVVDNIDQRDNIDSGKTTAMAIPLPGAMVTATARIWMVCSPRTDDLIISTRALPLLLCQPSTEARPERSLAGKILVHGTGLP